MPENVTVLDNGKAVWAPKNAQADLAKAGYQGILIHDFPVHPFGMKGITPQGTEFTFTWTQNWFLCVTLSREEEALVQAFSAVVGYSPSHRYRWRRNGKVTYEWVKSDKELAFEDLQGDTTEICNLERL